VTDEAVAAVAAADGAFLVNRTKTGKMVFVKKESVDRAKHMAKCREQSPPPPRLGQYCPTAYARKRMHDELGDFVCDGDEDDGMLRCACRSCIAKHGKVEGCVALCDRETRSCACYECALRCDTRMTPEELKQIVRVIPRTCWTK
jgi:hypothetical protein